MINKFDVVVRQSGTGVTTAAVHLTDDDVIGRCEWLDGYYHRASSRLRSWRIIIRPLNINVVSSDRRRVRDIQRCRRGTSNSACGRKTVQCNARNGALVILALVTVPSGSLALTFADPALP